MQWNGRRNDRRIAVLTTYVDDILVTGDGKAEMQEVVGYLLARCEGRDLGAPERSWNQHTCNETGYFFVPIHLYGRDRDRGDGLHGYWDS